MCVHQELIVQKKKKCSVLLCRKHGRYKKANWNVSVIDSPFRMEAIAAVEAPCLQRQSQGCWDKPENRLTHLPFCQQEMLRPPERRLCGLGYCREVFIYLLTVLFIHSEHNWAPTLLASLKIITAHLLCAGLCSRHMAAGGRRRAEPLPSHSCQPGASVRVPKLGTKKAAGTETPACSPAGLRFG